MKSLLPILVFALAAGGCSGTRFRKVPVVDAGPEIQFVPFDAGEEPDAGEPVDGGEPDAGPIDAGEPDAGCVPPTTESTVTTSNTVFRFTGVGPASTPGEAVLTDASGELLRLPFASNSTGGWGITVPLVCGHQTVEVSFPSIACGPIWRFITERQNCATADIQVTVSWDSLGYDWELHLVRPGGRINDSLSDCTWTTCIYSSPDWGVSGDTSDNPHKDVDNTGNFGPENIYLEHPEVGTFTVLVEHWGSSGSSQSDGVATILLSGASPVTIPIIDLAPHSVEVVATINTANGAITPLSSRHDCSLNWSGGCRDAIP